MFISNGPGSSCSCVLPLGSPTTLTYGAILGFTSPPFVYGPQVRRIPGIDANSCPPAQPVMSCPNEGISALPKSFDNNQENLGFAGSRRKTGYDMSTFVIHIYRVGKGNPGVLFISGLFVSSLSGCVILVPSLQLARTYARLKLLATASPLTSLRCI